MATTGNNVLFRHGTLSAYLSSAKDANTLYFLDDGQLYLGEQLIGRYYEYGDYSSADGKSWPTDNLIVGKLYIDTNSGEVREYVGTGDSEATDGWKVVLKASELDERINALNSVITVASNAVLTGITQSAGKLTSHTEVVPELSEITVSDTTNSTFKSYQLYLGNSATTGKIDIPLNTTIVNAAIGAANDTVSQTTGEIIGAESPSETDVLHIVYKNPQLPSGQQYVMVNAPIDMVKDLDVVKSTVSSVNTYTVMQGGSSVGTPIVVSDVTATSSTANNTTTYTFNVGSSKLMEVDVPYVTMAFNSAASSVDTYTISQGNKSISALSTITVPKSVSVTKTTDATSTFTTTYTVNQGSAAVSESIVVPEIRLTSESITSNANNTTYTLLEGSTAKGTIVVPNVTVALSASARANAFKTYNVQQNGTNVSDPIDIPAVTITTTSDSSTTTYTIKQGGSDIDDIVVPNNITVTELSSATSGYLKTYQIKQGSQEVGKIDIPKDFLVKSGSVKTVKTVDVPYTGAKVGDKYIDFVINAKDAPATDEHIYIPANSLVDVYTVDDTDTISMSISSNEITANVKSSSITSVHLAASAVQTVNIADDAVTEAKIADELLSKILAVQDVTVGGSTIISNYTAALGTAALATVETTTITSAMTSAATLPTTGQVVNYVEESKLKWQSI